MMASRRNRWREEKMVRVGDRVALESEKVGQPEKTGQITTINGRLIGVKWDDGRETFFVPSAGSLRVVEHEYETTRQL
jgi:hypothetical protein